jgi:hypothetical protein
VTRAPRIVPDRHDTPRPGHVPATEPRHAGAMDAFPPPQPQPYGPPCPGCGRSRTADDARGVAWSSRHTVDGTEFLCPDCTRAEVRQIEAGLPITAA